MFQKSNEEMASRAAKIIGNHDMDSSKKIKKIEKLLEAGLQADSLVPEYSSHPLVNYAILYSESAIARMLVDHGASLKGGKYNNAPILDALLNGQESLFEYLLAKGSDIHETTPSGDNAFFCAVYRCSIPTLNKIIDLGVDPLQVNKNGFTALMQLAGSKNTEKIHYMLSKGADVNAVSKSGRTALHEAVRLRSKEVVKALIEHGVDITIRDIEGKSAYDLATKYDTDILAILEATQKEAAERAKAPANGWHKTGDDEIALVSAKSALGYKITEIFNFTSRSCLIITKNENTNAETSTTLPFKDIHVDRLEQAVKEFESREGKLSESYTAGRAGTIKIPR